MLFFVVSLLLCQILASSATPFGQLILAYYSGVSLDTVGSGGLNAISMAFFAPLPMSNSNCDFSNQQTPCLAPAAGAGPSIGLRWALQTINTSYPLLRQNSKISKPSVFFCIWWAK